MAEGSLHAPIRHVLDWQSPDFTDMAKVDAECERVFDICHGCRRCFNLCDSFPRLFDMIDEAPSGELDGVPKERYAEVVQACTLCDLCFMTKCPYVPPHEFNLDFPHLMLRYRAAERAAGKKDFAVEQLTRTDRNGTMARPVAGLLNWASDTGNQLTRPIMEKVARIDRAAALPKFHGRTFMARAKADGVVVNDKAPAFGRRAALFATCFVNYNNPGVGEAARKVLAHNGVAAEPVYPGCCGMPQLEQGDIASVAKSAATVAAALRPLVDRGLDIIALVPSCALMLKFEWPLILPNDENVQALSKATRDISEYIVDIAKKEGLAPGLQPLEGGVTLHLACHARAQNMGAKAAEMLRLLPQADVAVIERCSGHGGSWGVLKENFEIALKVGKSAARQAAKNAKAHVCSECPLAGEHIRQGMERLGDETPKVAPEHSAHPIILMAKTYGL
mgnify:CR=1 FL=1